MKHPFLILLLAGTLHAQDTIKVGRQQTEEILSIAEEMPEPPGGIIAFYKFLGSEIRYPARAREQGLQGKCFLKFVVDAEGSIGPVEVIKGVPGCPECDAEAVRVLKSYPEKWKPGIQNGKPVAVYYNLPVSFKTQTLVPGTTVYRSEIPAQDSLKEPFTLVETMPEPPGGIHGFYKYITQNVRYPESARRKGLIGKVFMKFIVEADGSLSGFEVKKGIPDCPECDQEAIRVLKSYSQRWQPGTWNGNPARVYYNLPVSFRPDQPK
jgi:TonB family protein